MKTAKDYSGAKSLYFKPELKLCPNCNKPLKRSHIAWRKYIITLNGTFHVTSIAYKCSNTLCPQPQAAYHSKEAEMLSIKHYQFSIDVIAKSRTPKIQRTPNNPPDQANPQETIQAPDQPIRSRPTAPSILSAHHRKQTTRHIIYAANLG